MITECGFGNKLKAMLICLALQNIKFQIKFLETGDFYYNRLIRFYNYLNLII